MDFQYIINLNPYCENIIKYEVELDLESKIEGDKYRILQLQDEIHYNIQQIHDTKKNIINEIKNSLIFIGNNRKNIDHICFLKEYIELKKFIRLYLETVGSYLTYEKRGRFDESFSDEFIKIMHIPDDNWSIEERNILAVILALDSSYLSHKLFYE